MDLNSISRVLMKELNFVLNEQWISNMGTAEPERSHARDLRIPFSSVFFSILSMRRKYIFTFCICYTVVGCEKCRWYFSEKHEHILRDKKLNWMEKKISSCRWKSIENMLSSWNFLFPSSFYSCQETRSARSITIENIFSPLINFKSVVSHMWKMMPKCLRLLRFHECSRYCLTTSWKQEFSWMPEKGGIWVFNVIRSFYDSRTLPVSNKRIRKKVFFTLLFKVTWA